MSWLEAVKAAVAVGKIAFTFFRELEAQGISRLSSEAAKQDRRRVQKWAVRLKESENKGLRKLTKLDDQLPWYVCDLLQSSLLGIYLDPNTSELDRITARRAIMAGADGQDEPRVYPVH